MKIALVSLNQVWEDKETNKIRCKDFIRDASLNHSEIVIFPEMTLTGFSMNTEITAEDLNNSETIKWFRNQASQESIGIIFGLASKSSPKSKNHLLFIDKIGDITASYAKIHPFSYSTENQYFEGGNEIVSTSRRKIKIGFTICYDLRFPELYQGLSRDCEIIINIANWPKRRIEHWRTLLKARAIENQVFMVGVNRTGTDGNNIEYEKSSAVYAPDGQELKSECMNMELDIYKINIEEVSKIRIAFPVKNDRKIELYKNII